MILLPFICGLLVGLSFYFWSQHQTNRKIKQTLSSIPDNAAQLPSLPTLSLVRREINHHNQQRQDLQTLLNHWQHVLELAPISYLLVDDENRLLWANPQALRLLKIDRWQPGEQIRLLLELVRSYELDQLIEQTRSVQQPQVKEWVFYSTDYDFQQTKGKTKEVLLKGFGFPLEEQKVGVFLENQQALVELVRSRDRAFSDLTHELRTPLTSIRLVAEALQKRIQGAEYRWVEQLLQEANRLINLVENFSEIAQLENNTRQLDLEVINLKELIMSSWQTLKPLADKKELTLSYRGLQNSTLNGDKSRLTQVFLNLFDNSIKYSPSQTAIYVEVAMIQDEAQQPKWLTINFVDSGCGFAKADLTYVFDRLYRGDTSRQRSSYQQELPAHQGSGLGLAIAKQIIQAHNGSITARNHPETGGAWLQIKLPNDEK